MSDAVPPPSPQPHAPELHVTNRSLRGLASAVRTLIVASTLGAVATIAVNLSGIALIDDLLNGSADVGALESHDATQLLITVVWGVTALAAGICWAVWQYRAASSVAANALRRSAGWHAGAWFIPVIAWWFPFQNVKDLARASRAAVSSLWLGLWWALWIASSVAFWISNQMTIRVETLPDLTAASAISTLGSALWIAAAPFAWVNVTRITDAIDPIGH